jgi:hypothetical protein
MIRKKIDQIELPMRSWAWMGMGLVFAVVAWSCAAKWLHSEQTDTKSKPKLTSGGGLDDGAKTRASMGSVSMAKTEKDVEYIVEQGEGGGKQRMAKLGSADAKWAEARAMEWAAKQSARILSNQARGDAGREVVILTMGFDGPIKCHLRYEWEGKSRQSMILSHKECVPQKAKETGSR